MHMSNIKIFYHAVDQTAHPEQYHDPLRGLRIAEEQIGKMRDSGLLEVAELYANLHHTESNWDGIKGKFKDCKNIHWIFKDSDPRDLLFPTNILMKETADTAEEDFYALLVQQTGITYIEGIHGCAIPKKHHRWMQDYFCIERWKDCIVKLDEGYTAVGCGYSTSPGWPALLANTSWTTSKFLKTCNKFVLPSTIGFQKQFPGTNYDYNCEVESYLGLNGAKFYSFHDTNIDPYASEYPPSMYRTDLH